MTFVSLVVALLLDRARPLPDASVPLEWFRRYADATTIDADDPAERGAELARQAALD